MSSIHKFTSFYPHKSPKFSELLNMMINKAKKKKDFFMPILIVGELRNYMRTDGFWTISW